MFVRSFLFYLPPFHQFQSPPCPCPPRFPIPFSLGLFYRPQSPVPNPRSPIPGPLPSKSPTLSHLTLLFCCRSSLRWVALRLQGEANFVCFSTIFLFLVWFVCIGAPFFLSVSPPPTNPMPRPLILSYY